jgi:hypothetical protein
METAERLFRSTRAAVERGDLPVKRFGGRRCLCQQCSDDCFTATRSEFCGDCEIRYARGHTQTCH